MSTSYDQHRQIYSRIVGACGDVAIEPPWDFLSTDADCRGSLTNPGATLAQLQEEFEEVALLSAGILVPSAEGSLSLHPALCAPDAVVIALRDEPEADPYDLLTAHGCISGALPALAMLGDGWTREAIPRCNTLLCAADMRTALCLRAAGLAVTLATGLADLDGEGLRQLARRFVWTSSPSLEASATEPSADTADDSSSEEYDVVAHANRLMLEAFERSEARNSHSVAAANDDTAKPATQQAPTEESCSLVLVGWDVTTCSDDRPAGLDEIIARLNEAERHLGLRFGGVLVWQPDERTLAGIRYAIDVRDRCGIGVILAQAAAFCEPLSVFVPAQAAPIAPESPAPPHEPEGLQDALSRLRDTLAEEPSRGRISERARQAHRDFGAIVDRDLVDPLRAKAMRCVSPLGRELFAQLADVSGLMHRLAPVVQETTLRELNAAGNDVDASAGGGPLKQYLALMDRYKNLVTLIRSNR